MPLDSLFCEKKFFKKFFPFEVDIDSRLEKFGSILEHHKVAVKSTYASVTNSTPSNFKTIKKMAKVEEISEEHDCRSRANNIIIHGAKEIESVNETQNTDQIIVR